MSFRTYLVIGAAFGAFIFLMVMVMGDDIAGWGRDQKYEADIRNQNFISMAVFDPFIFVFDPANQPYGAIVAGLVWPAMLIWVLLTIMSVLIIAGIDVQSNITDMTGR